MTIKEVTSRTDDIINSILQIWERSVRATHSFLSEKDIQKISGYIPDALHQIPHLIVVQNASLDFIGFMGIDHTKLEMLFVSPEETGRGVGRQLVEHAIERYCVNEVCVNEQNPQAVGFYQHMGFSVYKRTELDEQGGPFLCYT